VPTRAGHVQAVSDETLHDEARAAPAERSMPVEPDELYRPASAVHQPHRRSESICPAWPSEHILSVTVRHSWHGERTLDGLRAAARRSPHRSSVTRRTSLLAPGSSPAD